MVCRPCQQEDHSSCPELARRVTISTDRTLAPWLKILHSRTGQVCDCQHGHDS